MPLTRKDIESRAESPKVKEVRIELLGDTVYMRSPSIAEWRRINQEHLNAGADKGQIVSMEAMAEVVGACLSDSEGRRLFDRKEEAQISERFGYDVFLELYEAGWEHCLARGGAEAKKD